MNQRKRFLGYMLMVFAVAAVIWAVARVYNTAQQRGSQDPAHVSD